MGNKQMALQKLAFTGTNPTVSCGICDRGVALVDCKEKEGKHITYDLNTQKPIEHYKLEYFHDKCNSLVAAAVVFNYEVRD